MHVKGSLPNVEYTAIRQLQCVGPLAALSGHRKLTNPMSLLGVKRTCALQMSANDPKRTLVPPSRTPVSAGTMSRP
jgi:hypothetical protein